MNVTHARSLIAATQSNIYRMFVWVMMILRASGSFAS